MDTGSPSDGDLIARVAARDVDAFGELHRRYVRAVLGLALGALADREEAEGSTNEVFAAVWRAAPQFDGARDDAVRWLYDAARLALGADRGAARASAWTSWQVHRALHSLPEDERHVIELAYWGGMQADEVAAFLHVRRDTVASLAGSALARLDRAIVGLDP